MGTLFQLASMFGPLAGAKFWVAVVMALAQFVNIYTGLDLGLDQETVTAIIAGVTALLVWIVPNKKKELPVFNTDEEALAYNNSVTGKNQTTVYRK